MPLPFVFSVEKLVMLDQQLGFSLAADNRKGHNRQEIAATRTPQFAWCRLASPPSDQRRDQQETRFTTLIMGSTPGRRYP